MDPAAGIDEPRDVGIDGDRIAAVEPSIPAELGAPGDRCERSPRDARPHRPAHAPVLWGRLLRRRRRQPRLAVGCHHVAGCRIRGRVPDAGVPPARRGAGHGRDQGAHQHLVSRPVGAQLRRVLQPEGLQRRRARARRRREPRPGGRNQGADRQGRRLLPGIAATPAGTRGGRGHGPARDVPHRRGPAVRRSRPGPDAARRRGHARLHGRWRASHRRARPGPHFRLRARDRGVRFDMGMARDRSRSLRPKPSRPAVSGPTRSRPTCTS